jgi:hypothetical protein
VRNLSASSQTVTLVSRSRIHHFPDSGWYGCPAFLPFCRDLETAKLLLVVSGGNQAPPDGTVITLMLTDEARGISFSATSLERAGT